jgi:hypothetical protein
MEKRGYGQKILNTNIDINSLKKPEKPGRRLEGWRVGRLEV